MGSLGSEEVLNATGQGIFLKLEPPKYYYAILEEEGHYISWGR